MEMFWKDIKYGARVLARSPGFAAVAVLTLALGIGANSAIFSVIDALVIRPLPFPDSKQLVIVWQTDQNRDIKRGTTSPPEYLEWRQQNKLFDSMSSWTAVFRSVRGRENPEQVWVSETSWQFFRMLRIKPFMGRDFVPDDETPGKNQVVLIDYGFWQRQYGGDPNVIGQTLQIEDKPYTVIGILPRGFSLFGTSVPYYLWTPMAFDREHMNRDDMTLVVFGRLKPGVSVPQAQAEMEVIQANQKRAFPNIHQENGVHVVNMHEDFNARFQSDLKILLLAVIAVLFVACANVANLLMARSASREKEIAVRSAMGAGRTRIVRQLLTESILLGILGGVVAIALGYAGVHLLHAGLPPQGSRAEIPHGNDLGINGAVVLFTMCTAIVTGLVFGLFPAFQVSYMGLADTLKENGRGTIGGRRGSYLRSTLVVVEVAVSIVLLIGAGLLIRSFFRMLTEHLGLNPDKVVTMQIWLPESRYAEGQPVANFYQQTLSNVSAVPGVATAGAVNFVPISGWRDFLDFDIKGRVTPRSGEQFTGQYSQADPNFFKAIGIPLIEGREFLNSDGPQSGGVAIINESLRQRYWPHEDPVGQQITLHFGPGRAAFRPVTRDDWLTIVGVVGDVREWEFDGKTPGIVYLPYMQAPSRLMCLVVKTTGDPMAVVPGIRDAVAAVDKNQAVTQIKTMDDVLAEAVSRRRLSMFLLSVFAGLATFLAAVGIYGLMSYAVTQRTHELGIRMTLGAEPSDVFRLVLGDGLRLALIGSAIGGVASIMVMRWVASELYGVRPFDPLTLGGVILFLVAVAITACYVPARRATRVDPMNALRYE
jgi:predicted permease